MITDRNKANIALLINTILWGISAPIIKDALQYVSPLYFLTYRFVLVVLLISPVFLIWLIKSSAGIVKKCPNRRQLRNLVIIGLLSTPVNLYLIFLGLQMTTALDAALLASLTPVFMAAGGVLFLKEKVNKQEKAGIIIALAGTLIFTLQPLFTKQELGRSSLVGNLLVIIGQLVYIVAMLLSKKEADKTPPMVQAYFSWICALIFFVPMAFLTNNLKLSNSTNLFLSPAFPHILYMAIFGSIIGFFAYLYGQSKIEASEAAVFTYLQPLFAAPLAVFWLKEVITWPFVLGCALIICGVILSEIRKTII